MFKFLLSAVFLAIISASYSTKYSVLPASVVDAVYRNMFPTSQDTAVEQEKLAVKVECEGISIAAALQDVAAQVAAADGAETVPIVIFVSLGGNGGSLLSGALEVVKEQFKQKLSTVTFTIYYVLNYQLPNPTQGNEFLLCEDILNKLRLMGATVCRFTTSGEKLDYNTGHSSVTAIIKEKLAEAKIFVDGLQSLRPKKGAQGGVVGAACAALLDAVRYFKESDTKESAFSKLVIVNNVPSGMHTSSGIWQDEDRQFKFDIIFSIVWNKPCVNTGYFADVQSYVLFFKLEAGTSVYDVLDDMIRLKKVVVTEHEKSLLEQLKLKAAAREKFVIFDKSTKEMCK